jgi:uncharacterized protein (TIGR03437 family)
MATIMRVTCQQIQMKIFLVCAMAAAVSTASAQTPSLSLAGGSGSPGGSVTVTVSLSANGGKQPASVEWDLTYVSADLGPGAGTYYTTGAAATAAGKQTQCNLVSPGDIRCLVAGLNSTGIGDGALAGITLQIAAGTTSTASRIALSGVSGSDGSGTAVTITGASATITISQPPPAAATLSSLTCSPASLTPPGTASCSVTLTAAAASASSVNLSSNSGSVTVPSSVTIASGATNISFTASAPSAVSSNGSAILTASLNGNSRNFSLGLTAAQVTQPAVSSLTCSPSTLSGGASTACTVSLTGAAPAGGTPVSLSSNSPSASAPAQVTVPAGLTSTTFTVNTAAVTSTQSPVLSAGSSGVTVTSTLTLKAPALNLGSLTCGAGTTGAGSTVPCTVTLTAAAPAPGVTIALASNSPLVTVPSNVAIATGSSSASFSSSTGTPAADTTVVLTAAWNGATVRFSLTVLSSPTALLSLSCSPSTVLPGGSTMCTVALTAAAPAGGVTVAVGTSNPSVAVPSSITVASGSSAGAFRAAVGAGAGGAGAPATVTIAAAFRGSTVQGTISLLSPSPAAPASAAPVLNTPADQSTQPGKMAIFKVSATDPAGLAVTLSASGLPANATFDPNTGTFAWTPKASQYGMHAVHFTAIDTAQNSSSQDVVIKVGSSTPVIVSLANSASYTDDGGCSPGTVATLLGAGFVNTADQGAVASPLPTELNGLQVMINGTYVPIFYAGEFQINFQCPTLAPGQAISLQVRSSTGSSAMLWSKQQYVTPGIFTLDGSGTGQGAILLSGTNTVAMPHVNGIPSQPAKPGKLISIYAAGLGPVSADLPAGQPAPLHTLVTAEALIDVLIGGSKAQVQFAGLAPGFVGLYQVNAQIPKGTPAGNAVPVEIIAHLADGTAVNSNQVTIAVAAQ